MFGTSTPKPGTGGLFGQGGGTSGGTGGGLFGSQSGTTTTRPQVNVSVGVNPSPSLFGGQG